MQPLHFRLIRQHRRQFAVAAVWRSAAPINRNAKQSVSKIWNDVNDAVADIPAGSMILSGGESFKGALQWSNAHACSASSALWPAAYMSKTGVIFGTSLGRCQLTYGRAAAQPNGRFRIVWHGRYAHQRSLETLERSNELDMRIKQCWCRRTRSRQASALWPDRQNDLLLHWHE